MFCNTLNYSVGLKNLRYFYDMETTKQETPILYYHLKDADMSFHLVNGFIINDRFISRRAAFWIELNKNKIYLN